MGRGKVVGGDEQEDGEEGRWGGGRWWGGMSKGN